MKDFKLISENELDGALNALFLETYSKKEDERIAHFVMEQEYDVVINLKKEAELLARLNGKKGGKNGFLWALAFLLISATSFVLYNYSDIGIKKQQVVEKEIAAPQITTTVQKNVLPESAPASSSSSTPNSQDKVSFQTPINSSPLTDSKLADVISPNENTRTSEQPSPPVPNDSEKELPYFNKAGLAFFAKVKEQMIQQVVKIDDKFYAKTEPGVTMYKSREVIVAPFVMSDFPVTNLQYKTFLADLASQGRVDDLKKCLPKQEVWKEYGCIALAKNYFESEYYNNFPVVNVTQEACILFCEWLEVEANEALAEASPAAKFKSNPKGASKRKQIIVRVPFDYEWIYSADAAYSLIPNCDGYNTIYDPTEGLVDKGFYKRTSLISKRDKRNLTRMDNLSDVNRYGMSETEMIAIFKEAVAYGDSKKTGTEKLLDDDAIEAASLAGHVTELIKDKEGGMTVRGCCWQNKEEYLKMMDVYKKNGVSPFVGFRVVILNAERGKDKNPFW